MLRLPSLGPRAVRWVLAGLLAATATAQGPPTWTTLYTAVPGPPVDRLHVLELPSEVVVYVTGPSAEIERRSSTGVGGSVPPTYVPGAGLGPQYFVSENGARLALSEIGPAGALPRTTLHHFKGDGGLAGNLELDRPARFLIGNDGTTIVAFEPSFLPSGGGSVTVHDGNGTPRSLLWSGDLGPVRIHRLRLSGQGNRLGISRRVGLEVFSCLPGAPDRPDFALPPAPDFRLSPDGELVAVMDEREVRIHERVALLMTVPTSRAPIDVAIVDRALGVVLETGSVRLIDPVSQTVLHQRAAPAGAEYRSMDVSVPGDPTLGALVVALGVRRTVPAGLEGSMEVLTLDRVGAVHVEDWPSFTLTRWNRASPAVRFLPSGERVLAWTRDAVRLSSEVR